MLAGDFPKLEPVNHSLVHLNAPGNQSTILRDLPERGARQYGRFVLFRTSLKTLKDREKEKSKTNDNGEWQPADDDSGER